MDQPFTTPLGSKAGRGPGVEKTARRIVQLVAQAEDVAELGAAVGRRQLAAVEAVDLAPVLVGAEGRLDPAQPADGRLNGRLDALGGSRHAPGGSRHAPGGSRHAPGGSRGAHVEGDDRSHHGLVVYGSHAARRRGEVAHRRATVRAVCRD